jgi:RHS repeat-associated protein
MGKERDPETNNDEFGARSYASAYGRFLSADWSSTPSPVPYANLTNPQTLNLYAMVSDNPESFADLDGHMWFPALGGCADSALGSCNPQSNPGTATQNAGTAQNQNQGAGTDHGTASFTLGGITVTFKWQVNQEQGGVDITATPTKCDDCEWAQTVSGTGVESGKTKADIQKDREGNEYDAHKYPFAAPTEHPGQLFDQPARSVSPASVQYTSTVGTSDGKSFNPKGSLVWGFSKDSNGSVSFSGVRPAAPSEQKQSLAAWGAKTGMTTGP